MCPLCDRIQNILAGNDPGFIAEMSESYVVLADQQGCRGWCVLLAKRHHDHLADLPRAQQLRLFDDVSRVAAAIRRATGPSRLNYECLGNQVSHIHWHVIPRHADDPDPRNAIWGWPPERLKGGVSSTERLALIGTIRAALTDGTGGAG